MKTQFKETLCYDDVLLQPLKSDIRSRTEVDISSNIGPCKFTLPIISSPMDTVTEIAMMGCMSRLGGLGILHRYNLPIGQASVVAEFRSTLNQEQQNHRAPYPAAAIGCTADYKKRAKYLVESGAEILCIDIAHGHHVLMEEAIKSLKDQYGEEIQIIAGNVATPEAYSDLTEWGADAVRIGIGGGSICSTRIQTGHGIPTFQSVLDCAQVDGAPMIADGGIKSAGDIVKSLAAGADFVMLGSMLAGTMESPGDVLVGKGDKKYKVYRGMASPEAQTAWRGHTSSLEGVSTTIPYKGSVEEIVSKLQNNIRSGLSYSGARTIRELQLKAKFIRQTQSGLRESNTHILQK